MLERSGARSDIVHATPAASTTTDTIAAGSVLFRVTADRAGVAFSLGAGASNRATPSSQASRISSVSSKPLTHFRQLPVRRGPPRPESAVNS